MTMYSRNALVHAILAFATAFLVFRYYANFRSTPYVMPIKVVNFPDRGKGIVATRDIMQGELIIKEEPLFLVQAGSFKELGTHIRSIISGLNATSRSTFFELSHASIHSDANVPLAIFQTNSLKISDDMAGIFPMTSRLNHGCSKAENSVYSWREEGILVVHALKHIKKGQEILRGYIDTRQPRKKRRADLYEAYAFDCSCSVCTLSPGEAERSDIRLSSMATIQARFSKWKEDNINGQEAVRLAKQIWELGEKENYWKGRGRLAEDVVNLAATYKDAKATRQWAELAAKWYSYELGSDSSDVVRMNTLRSDPSKHPTWATREALDIGGPDMILI